VLINLVFATAFNLPCLWLQRFTRLRLLATLDAGEPSSGRSGPAAHG
jgi:glycosyl-4,4'-diaponeurosporenoate acyltransferase